MQDLNLEMIRLRKELTNSINISRRRGEELAENEKNYRIELAKEMLKERANKTPVTIINDLARGKEEIALLKFERDKTEALYKSANERIQATKLEIRVVEGEMQNMRRGV